MRRGYRIEEVVPEFVSLKADCPELSIGTSIIVGFPGESEEDFQRTLNVCEEIKFDYIHVHNYSDRNNTEANAMPDKIEANVILKRSRKFKECISSVTPFITIAEDAKGNRSCQG